MFTYFAKTNKSFARALENELYHLGVKPNSITDLNTKGLNFLKFKSTQSQIWNIILNSRLIEGMKIQIKENIPAGSEKEFKININKVEYKEFLPIENADHYKIPDIKAYSYRSKLFHEGMIENIFKTSMNKIAYRMKEGQPKEKTDREKDSYTASIETEEKLLKKLEERKQCNLPFNVVKTLPRIDLILQNDKCRILLDLCNKPLHMHGYKAKINWGSLRETYACALIYFSGLLNKFKESNKLYVWDPFCGSGTILIELFTMTIQRSVRNVSEISHEGFTNLPFHNRQDFKEFVKSEKQKSENLSINFTENTEIHLIASDIEMKAISALSQNAQKAQIKEYNINLKQENKINMAINPTIYHENFNRIFDCFIADFEVVAKEVIFNDKLEFKNKKFNIISNIPYGTSHELSDKIEVKKLYRRLGKFLRKYEGQLEDVFILVNKRDKDDEVNFKKLTEMKWKVIDTFDNNGIEVEFLKMLKSTPTMIE